MKNKSMKSLFTALAGVSLVIGSVGAAQASEMGENTSEFVPFVDSSESKTLNEALTARGSTLDALSEAEVAALAASGELPGAYARAANGCNSWRNAAAFNTGWSESKKTDCAIAGARNTIIGYFWEVDNAAVGGSICIQALGARPGANGLGGVLYWHNGGCATSGGFNVDWKNSLHHKTVKGMAATAPVWGLAYKWK